MSDTNRKATFSYAAERLNRFGLAYLHVLEALPGHSFALPPGTEPLTPTLGKKFRAALIVNGGYLKDTANEAIKSGAANLVSFGVPFIANPDLVERFRLDAPLNEPDFATFYTGGEKGFAIR